MDNMSNTAQETKKAEKYPYALLINNQERLETIHVPRSDGKTGGEHGPLLVLMPGVNIVQTDTIAACRTNKIFDAKFKTKIPKSQAKEAQSERVGQPMLVLGKEVPAKSPLAVLPDEEALEVVNDTGTVELLNLFAAGETRTEIRAAIDDRKKLIDLGLPENET